MHDEHFSSSQTWRRFKKNKPALLGFFFIVIAVLAAVFGYLIAPDSTPDADLQTLEIQAKKPGFKQLFLLLPEKKAVKENVLQKLFLGSETQFRYLPINSFVVKQSTLYVQKLVDEDTSVLQSYNINTLKFQTPAQLGKNFIVRKFWLGTDVFGRDILSRIIIGTRVSLAVGFIAVVISMLVGILLGSLAGYYRGWVDDVIMWFVNVTSSIPTVLLVFAITIALGKGFWQIFIAVGLTMWVNVARLVRGQVMAIKQLEYVQSAKVLGYTDSRIIFKHILPNISGPLLVIASANFASAIIIEAGLSFLGIGIQPPQPSWGFMIKENYNFIITNNPFIALVPGCAIMLLVLAFNLMGNGLRDSLDVRAS